MRFIDQPAFWILIGVLAVLYVSFFVSGYLRVVWAMQLKKSIGIVFLGVVVLIFLSFGVGAGFASLIFTLAWSFLSVPIIRSLARRINPELHDAFDKFATADRQRPSGDIEDSLRYMAARSDMQQIERIRASRDPLIRKVLNEFGKSDADLDLIYQVCLASGLGTDAAWKIVTNSQHLRSYLALKKRGISDIQAALQTLNEG